jgi:hypothetical protein
MNKVHLVYGEIRENMSTVKMSEIDAAGNAQFFCRLSVTWDQHKFIHINSTDKIKVYWQDHTAINQQAQRHKYIHHFLEIGLHQGA